MVGELTADQVIARDAEIVARLSEIDATPASTVAVLAERRSLRLELRALREAQNSILDDVEIPELAQAPAPAPVVTVDAIDAAISEVLDAELVTASAGVPAVIVMAETSARPSAASIITASSGETPGGPVDLRTFGNRMQDAARHLGPNSSKVTVASVQMLDSKWSEGFITTDDRAENNRVIRAAQQAHREQRLTAAASGVTTAACGVPNVWNDATSCFSVDTSVLDDIAAAPANLAGLCEVEFNKAVVPGAYNLTAWCDADQVALAAALAVTPATATSLAAIANLQKKTITLAGCPDTDTLVACGFPIRVQVPVCASYSNNGIVQEQLNLVQEASKQTRISYLLANLDAKSSAHLFDGSAGLSAIDQILAIINAYKHGAHENVDPAMLNGVTILEHGFQHLLALSLMTKCGGSAETAMSKADDVLAELSAVGKVRFVHTGAWAAFRASLGAPGAAAVAFPNIPRAFDVRWYDADSWFSTAPTEIPFGVVPYEGHEKNMITWFGEAFAGYGLNGCVRPLKLSGTWNFLGVAQECKDLVTTEPLFF